ncbi:glycosyl transferase family 90 [Thalassorhabdomicrobium marinisediminis]|uniref:glycosyl transferase family 90 n=1 Tax=Thalassorhabdomicrobium marinisediminis TaxID=2170577 RepID=UPI0024917E1F|nr:glycosyl transferase family 90 [Thalassorhabdomicrobium marinisediminis]
MPEQARPPRVFGIGLPMSGGAWLGQLFTANGYLWRHEQGGKIAVDLAYALAAGTPPLRHWPHAVGVSGLSHLGKRHLPPVFVQDLVPGLLARFPDAYFILTHRDEAAWIADRLSADGGAHRSAAAWHARVAEADLPDLWAAEQRDHIARCKRLFADYPRFLCFNVTSDPFETLQDFFAPDYHLTAPEPRPQPATTTEDATRLRTALRNAPTPPPAPPPDMNFVRNLVDFAGETKGTAGHEKHLSPISILWRAHGFLDRTGAPAPLLRAPDGTLRIDAKAGLERAQGALGELLAHGAEPPLNIDMMDARFLGTKGRRAAPPRTVVYNRRKGATNLTLWPLPGYHTLAPRGAVGGYPVDQIPFVEKIDRCVWLGNLTGRMSPALTPKGRTRHGVYALRARMEDLPPEAPDWDDVIDDLACVPRYRIVKKYRDHIDFVVGFVLRDKWKALAETPALRGLCVPMKPRDWFHRYRYILSLAGNDTGSNFLMAAASNALILKEEDGWELFYTEAFRPWVHYVPLAEGAADVEDKLAWARANPTACADMVRAATEVYDRIADPATRAALLRGIAERLNASA